MLLQKSNSFNDRINQIYSYKTSHIKEEVNDFLDKNLVTKALIIDNHINIEDITSKITSSLFVNSIHQAIDEIYSQSVKKEPKNKLIFNMVFNFSNYIDYLILQLERQEKEGYALVAPFVKKLQSFNHLQKNIEFKYDICFDTTPQHLIVGYCYTIDNQKYKKIKKHYKEVQIEITQYNILSEIYNMDAQISLEQATHLATSLTDLILSQQIDKMQPVYYQPSQFIELIDYSSHIIINSQQMNQSDAITYLQTHYPSLISEQFYSNEKND